MRSKIKNILKKARRAYYTNKCKKSVASYIEPVKVNRKSFFTSNTILGGNTNFNGLHIYGAGIVRIGDNFHSGTECMFITQNHNFDTGTSIPYDETYLYKDIMIEDNVWIGSRVTILGGVTVGEGAIIQAGAVVVKDIPKYGIAGGNPATVFKYRDIEHYEKLKCEQNFF